MPTFRTHRPNSIAKSFAALLGSSPALSAKDLMDAELAGATVNQRLSLAEKAMLEVQQMREQEAMRRDPGRAVQYGAMTSGLDVPVADQLYRAIQGMVAPNGGVTADDEGNPLPPATYAKPEGVRPEQERAFRSSIAATMANLLATGKTNAAQLATAGGTLNENAVRNAAVGLPADQQNAQVGAYRASAREPFSGGVNAQGLTINQETGAPVMASQVLHDAAVEAARGLSSQREAAATLAEARATAAGAKARGGGGGAGGTGREAGNAAEAWQKLTGTKLSTLPAQQRTAWIQNHTAGMAPETNLAALKQAPKGGAADKPLTESQGRAQMFGTRAAEADAVLEQIEDKVSLVGLAAKRAVENVPGAGMAANKMLSANQQRVEQAQRNFVNAVLRQESGAVISDAEFANAQKQYFPQPGDSKEVIEQKRANRRSAIEGFRMMAGAAGARVEEARQQPGADEARKVVGGKSYVKIKGQWYEDRRE